MGFELIILLILILLVSVVIHEVSHGYVAYLLGDPTAHNAGRLTLNPLKHLDPLGSIIIPLILALSPGGFIIGWAKPVPYNPYNLRNQRWGEAMVAAAGPLANILLAVFFALVIRVTTALDIALAAEALSYIVFINILLAFFNLIPVPPLDGSKILAALISPKYSHLVQRVNSFVQRNALIVFIGFIFIFLYALWPIFFYLINWVFQLLTGTPMAF